MWHSRPRLCTGEVGVAGNLTVTMWHSRPRRCSVAVAVAGTFQNLLTAEGGVKIGAGGDTITQLNHGNLTVGACPEARRVSVPKATLDVANADGTAKGTADATLTPGAQTVTLNIGACQTDARLLVTPRATWPAASSSPGPSATTACGTAAPGCAGTNYSTTATAGSVTVSYEVIR